MLSEQIGSGRSLSATATDAFAIRWTLRIQAEPNSRSCHCHSDKDKAKGGNGRAHHTRPTLRLTNDRLKVPLSAATLQIGFDA